MIRSRRENRFADRSIGELGKGEKLAAATFMRIISQLHLKQLPAARSGLLTVGWASLALLAGRQIGHGANYTWTGGGASSRWSEAGNWRSSQPPHSGETAAVLVFPVGAARLTSTNDLTNLGVDELAIAGTGYVLAGTNALLLSPNAPVSVQATGWTNRIALPLVLQGTNIFQVAANAALSLAGNLTGPGGFSLSGGGRLELAPSKGQDNTYAGPAAVRDGILQLNSGFVTNPVFGNRTYALAVPGALTVGQIGGTNIAIVEGMAMSTNTALTLLGSGQYQVAGDSLGFGSLAGDGLVNLVEQGFQVGFDNRSTVFSGTFTNRFETGLYKVGSGSLTLSGRSSGNVPLGVLGGTLFLDGDFSASTVQNSAMLRGNGQVGFFLVDGPVSPGHGGPGRLTGNSIAFDQDSLFLAKLGGTNAGVSYDQLVAKQSFGFTDRNAALQVELLPGFVGTAGDQYTIVRDDSTDPIVGNFNGMPEGTVFKLPSGAAFRISYQGGDGNDVVLTQTSLPTQPSLNGVVHLGGGIIQINGFGEPNLTYTVMANTNLATTNWVNIGTATASSLGVLQFTDFNTNNYLMRFYRFSWP